MDKAPSTPGPTKPPSRFGWRRVAGWGLEVFMVVLIAGIVLATVTPAIVRYLDDKKAARVETK